MYCSFGPKTVCFLVLANALLALAAVDVNTLLSLFEYEGYVDSLYYRQAMYVATAGDKNHTEQILQEVIDAATEVKDTDDAKTGKEVLKELKEIKTVDHSSHDKLLELYSKTLQVIKDVIPKVNAAVNSN